LDLPTVLEEEVVSLSREQDRPLADEVIIMVVNWSTSSRILDVFLDDSHSLLETIHSFAVAMVDCY